MGYFLIVAATLLADQLTKLLVVKHFSLHDSVAIIPGVLNLTYVTNRGAAFSILAEGDSWWRQPFFVLVGLAALIGLTVFYFRIRRETPVQAMGLALIAGGALGNLIDRLRLGEVVDFIDVYWSSYHWPAFNIADSAICIGAGIFLVFSYIEKNPTTTTRGTPE